VIDPTISMSRFDIATILSGIESRFNVESVYFGDVPIGAESVSEGGNPGFDYRDLQIADLLRSAIASGGTNILLVTDGQTANFIKAFDGARNLSIFLLEKDTRNISVSEVSIFPAIGIEGGANRFVVKIRGDISPNDRLRITMDGDEIYSGIATANVAFDRFIEKRGVHEIAVYSTETSSRTTTPPIRRRFGRQTFDIRDSIPVDAKDVGCNIP
jgi:hypothetical protein